MSKLANQYVDVFAAGNHGEKGAFTEGDLDQIVQNYDPSHHEAPAVVGHPKNDGPAYGWVEGLRRVGNVLQAKFKQVVPAFEEAVESGRYKKRSVSLYKGANGWSLRHVGFLGAQPPEIKGLADIKFEQEDKDSVEVEFEESDMATDNQAIADSVWERMKAHLGIKPADAPKTFSEEEVRQFATDAAKAAADAAIAPLQAELDKRKATFSEPTPDAQVKLLSDGAVAKLKASGHWLPRFELEGVPALFSELAKDATTVEFGEGEQKKSQSLLDTLVAFAEAFPKPIPTGSETAGARAAADFSEMPAGADPNSFQLSQLAKAKAKTDNISFSEALDKIVIEHPELTKPGGATAGEV